MVCDEDMEAVEVSDSGPATVGRPLHPLVMRYLPSTVAENEQEPSWVEADPVGWDAPISVWWDQPPVETT
jgi:hypothetical protein